MARLLSDENFPFPVVEELRRHSTIPSRSLRCEGQQGSWPTGLRSGRRTAHRAAHRRGAAPPPRARRRGQRPQRGLLIAATLNFAPRALPEAIARDD